MCLGIWLCSRRISDEVMNLVITLVRGMTYVFDLDVREVDCVLLASIVRTMNDVCLEPRRMRNRLYTALFESESMK